MEILEQIKKEFADFEIKKNQFVEILRPQFTLIFKQIFDEYPELESFKYTQYCPYFADGNECFFSVNECYDIKLTGQDDFIQRYNSNFPDSYLITFTKINKILFKIPEEIMKNLFGDHCEVIINRDNTINVEEYEHD